LEGVKESLFDLGLCGSRVNVENNSIFLFHFFIKSFGSARGLENGKSI
jgi:hypothetical protein